VDRIEVVTGNSELERHIKTPIVGICELIWNAFDADAEDVVITWEVDELGALSAITITDDGLGLSELEAARGFGTFGDSWKTPVGTRSESKKRLVHGRYGRGRYSAFSMGNSVTWDSTYADGEELKRLKLRGNRSDLRSFTPDSTSPVERENTGLAVRITDITAAGQKRFDDEVGLKTAILSTFALYLEEHHDFGVTLGGNQLDPKVVQTFREDIPIAAPEGVDGADAVLTVIEWNLDNVRRRLYLCDEDGLPFDDIAPGIHAPGAEFTAYLKWAGFDDHSPVALEEDTDSPAGLMIAAAKHQLKDSLLERSRLREAELVGRWRHEGVYPYEGEPTDAVESAKREAFNVVAMAAARTVEAVKATAPKKLALALMREAFERHPESVVTILEQVANLPKDRAEELSYLLRRTTLSNMIQVSGEIGDRLDFIHGLSEILFDPENKKTVKERKQLHRILARETWIFGEEWALTGDDENLTVVLANYRKQLDDDTGLLSDEPVLREDGSVGIPDLVLGKQLSTSENHWRQLVVELKRPSKTIDMTDVVQLQTYADAIVNDQRFAHPNTTWDFWIIGNKLSRTVSAPANASQSAVITADNYRIIAKTWAELLGDARHRLKFVQKALEFSTSGEHGLAYVREHYSEYLPDHLHEEPEATETDPAPDEGPDPTPPLA
jgi:hypothetical protein